jgi:SAM-dependent methyltransferase
MKDTPNILGAEVRMASRRVFALALFLLNLLPNAGAAFGQSPASGAVPAGQRKTSEPYTGDLSAFDSPGRDERLQINRVMDILGIAAGKSVADIGAGSGWFTVRAARRVGADGLVYAVDINPEAVKYVGERAQKEQLQNVKTILSKADDPLLPADSVDAVLMLKTYHEVAQPVVLLRNLRGALRPGAKVGVIDRNGNGEDHGVGRDVVIREAKEAGYELMKQYDFVKGDKMDYFLVFTAKP